MTEQQENNNTQEEKVKAFESRTKILKQPGIFNRYIKEFGKKIAGEEKNKKLIFLSSNGRLVLNTINSPHNIIISASSSGKDYVASNVLKIYDKKLVIEKGRVSPTALDYMIKDIKNWTGLILYIQDITNALLESTSFKLLASKTKQETLSHVITIQNKATHIDIKGQPIIITTTAKGNPGNEILNRFNLMSMDESEEQTQVIKKFQTKLATQKHLEKYDKDLRLALSLLKPYYVIVPFANEIESEFDNDIRVRRNLPRFLDLIKCSAIFHQFQREKEDNCVIANKKDLEIAKSCFNFKDNIKLNSKEISALKTIMSAEFDLETWGSVNEFHNRNPIVSLQSWYKYIDRFNTEKLIECKEYRVDGVFKPVNMYCITDKGKKYLKEVSK